jgi:hypothetical protein
MNSDQQHLPTSGAGQSSLFGWPSEWHGSLAQLPRQFRTGLCAGGQRHLCRHASMAESVELLEVTIRGKA